MFKMRFDVVIQFAFKNLENFIDGFLFQIIKNEFDREKLIE